MQKRFTIKQSANQSAKNLLNALPIILTILLLISLLSQILTKGFYQKIFTGSFIDTFIGSFIGSISIGAPIISYIIGGEILNQGVSLIAVTAFIVSWVSVGVLTFPFEAKYLGKKFALVRNIFSFIFSIIVAFTTVAIFNLI